MMNFGTKGCMYCEGECNKECLPKQETLEEAAERLYPTDYGEKSKNIINMIKQDAFTSGAKWQQEQDKNKYSKEEVQDILRKSHSIKKLHEWFLDY